ncbi:serine protease [Rheinheimera riviphila]|uniref:Serine protease n=1 Tax=Rheinheimera riviphila TaxID=1834037 RepID=A0A437QFE9_9GAMM|nr:S8 family serine peptidase [Rheinheimera riviphila]RVU33175.1 serine protease [Rheinheimera riviphila]
MQLVRRSMLSAAVLLALTACNGNKDNNIGPNTASSAISGTKMWLPVQGSFKASDANNDALTITSISEGTANISAQNGVYQLSNGTLAVNGLNFVFTPTKNTATSITFTVSDGELRNSGTVSIAAAAGDPLQSQQWALKNTGQRAYSLGESALAYMVDLYKSIGQDEATAKKSAAAQFAKWEQVLVPGQDMNVPAAYALGATGQNTIAVVVDSGLELAHEDLEANILPNRSLNFIANVAKPTDPSPTSARGDHGTSVAGLIAAVGWNGKGGHGVAPDTKLIGMNYLSAQTDLAYFLSHGIPGSGIESSEPLAVFNRSYGITHPGALEYDVLDEAVQQFSSVELRNGKGAVNTKSSGNSFRSGSRENNLCSANGARTLGLTCYNGNMEPSQATPYYISIGSVNSDGKHTSYSTAGANLFVAAPSGEYGDTAPAMVTTDQMTCLRGYSSFANADYFDTVITGEPGYFAAWYPFNTPGHDDNPSCNYTSSFNGTSSAAPNAAGVIALMLSANPNLSYRDVKHILAASSSKVDPTNAKVKLTLADGEFVAHDGWVKNKAGFEHNNYYGFGRVNAGKAVELAKAYTRNLGELKMSAWVAAAQPLALPVPDNSVTGAEISIEIADDITLEGAQFKFNVLNDEMTLAVNAQNQLYKEFHTTAGIDLAIEVTSPQGTRSVLLSSKQALVMPAAGELYYQRHILKDHVFLSNAFFGEKAKGTWKIKVLDANGTDINATGGILNTKGYLNNKQPSVVTSAAVRVFGN